MGVVYHRPGCWECPEFLHKCLIYWHLQTRLALSNMTTHTTLNTNVNIQKNVSNNVNIHENQPHWPYYSNYNHNHAPAETATGAYLLSNSTPRASKASSDVYQLGKSQFVYFYWPCSRELILTTLHLQKNVYWFDIHNRHSEETPHYHHLSTTILHVLTKV